MARHPRVVGILQARMGSSRLPGKVLASLGASTVLEELLRRLAGSRRLDALVVATTAEPEDDAIVAVARARQIPCFRGSATDVLDRVWCAAQAFAADVVVRLTADNPLVDGGFVDTCVERFLASTPAVEYLDTMSSGTFPYGLAVEVMRREALGRAWTMATRPEDREHVTLFIREHGDRFQLSYVRSPVDHSGLRWTIDTQADLDAMRALYARLCLDAQERSWEDIAESMQCKVP
jgi:spore coat polysaccharide biosynthesis protein SpsF (cytidylyltransferase family)